MSWVSWVCAVFGILLCTAAFRTMREATRFASRAERATATVLPYKQHVSEGDDGPTTMNQLVLRMQLAGKKPFEHVDEMSTSWQPYAVGSVLRVLYDPANPGDFRIDSTRKLYFRPKLMFMLGMIFLMQTVLFGVLSPRGNEIVSVPGAADR